MKSKFLPFEIVYEDKELIAIDKPAGLLTTHTALVGRAARESQLTAENLLTAYVRKGQLKSSKRIYLVHRLDRDTSGVMIFAKSEEFSEMLREKWNELTEKTYFARVEGELKEAEGEFVSYLKDDPKTMKVHSVNDERLGKLARTIWKRIKVERGTTLVEVNLKSGRKNQIRVHFSEAGHPVVGDIKYGGHKVDRLHLHAVKLILRHPKTAKQMEFSSNLPKGL